MVAASVDWFTQVSETVCSLIIALLQLCDIEKVGGQFDVD